MEKEITKYVLAIDIGGSKLIVGIVASSGKIIDSIKLKLDNVNENQLIEIIVKLSQLLLSKYNYKIKKCGIAIPGLVDSKKGEWLFSPYSKITNFSIAKILEKRLLMKVFIENDVNVCALAEMQLGACKNIPNFFWMTISNGIGGAIVINNKLYKGAFSHAGEIGHIKVVDDGVLCGCGNKGCLEMYASGSAIERRYNNRTKETISAMEIAKKATKGDVEAVNIYNSIGKYLGLALSYVSNLLNVEKIILGGGVMEEYKLFKSSLINEFDNNVFKKANMNTKIEKSKLGYNATLIGAALIAMK